MTGVATRLTRLLVSSTAGWGARPVEDGEETWVHVVFETCESACAEIVFAECDAEIQGNAIRVKSRARESLKTTLKAEIDPEAWATLNRETTRPFERPKSGRIAVKVINHLGDEVMKVFRVE